MRRAGEELARRHKALEGVYGQRLAAGQGAMVRLDGHRFSRFTAPFHKPYDWRLFRAMQLAAADLLALFSPRAVYTQSDELTLLLDRCLLYHSLLASGAVRVAAGTARGAPSAASASSTSTS